jgi:hypothetical protein
MEPKKDEFGNPLNGFRYMGIVKMEPKVIIDENGTPGTDLNYDYNKSKDDIGQIRLETKRFVMSLNIKAINKTKESIVITAKDPSFGDVTITIQNGLLG